jgi:hypothetical protein
LTFNKIFDRLLAVAMATLVSLGQFFGAVWNVLSKVINQGFRAKWLASNVQGM